MLEEQQGSGADLGAETQAALRQAASIAQTAIDGATAGAEHAQDPNLATEEDGRMLAEDASTYVTFARLRPDSLGAEATFRPLGADGAPIPGAEYWYGDVQRDGKGGTAVVDYERERAKPEGSNYFVEKTSTLVINAGQSPILIRRRRRDGEKEATEVGRGPATKADVARASAQLAAATAEKNPTPPPAAAVQPTR